MDTAQLAEEARAHTWFLGIITIMATITAGCAMTVNQIPGVSG